MERKAFLGVYTTQQVKDALESEADRQDTTMSVLAHRILSKSLAGVESDLDPNRAMWKRGRPAARRGSLHPKFRALILTSARPRGGLAQEVGFSPASFNLVLRESPVILTARVQSRLATLARLLGYTGPILKDIPND